MNLWILLQIAINLFFLACLIIFLAKLRRKESHDDPRLSRGLQLLQSKIAVLEDLSDKTEQQSHQLCEIMEQKYHKLQSAMMQADRQIHLIDQSIAKSLEVAKIFQDKIPHKEILDRQNKIKYVKAANLAHQGCSLEEISKQVDLPNEELDFLIKTNKDNLLFSNDELPSWITNEVPTRPTANLDFVDPKNCHPKDQMQNDKPLFSIPKSTFIPEKNIRIEPVTFRHIDPSVKEKN